MNAQHQKRIIQQTLQVLDYELHACQQTLRFLQLGVDSNASQSTNLIQNQQTLYLQLQDRHDKLVEQLSELG